MRYMVHGDILSVENILFKRSLFIFMSSCFGVAVEYYKLYYGSYMFFLS